MQLKAVSKLGHYKVFANPNQKSELGNQTYTKRCALYSRMQCPSFRGVASKTIKLFLKNTCMGDIELLYRLSMHFNQFFSAKAYFKVCTEVKNNLVAIFSMSIPTIKYYRTL